MIPAGLIPVVIGIDRFFISPSRSTGMHSRTWLTLFCLFLIVASAGAVCWGDAEIAPPSGFPDCPGSFADSYQEHWPRLPTDTEIGTAKEDYLTYLQDQNTKIRIDDVKIVKYHYCEGDWTNHGDMRVQYSWWWTSTTGEGAWQSDSKDASLIYLPGTKTFEFAVNHVPSPYFSFNGAGFTQGFATGPCSRGTGVTPTTSGGAAKPPADDEEFPWVVVIGALGALGVAGIAGAKVLGGKKESLKPAPSGKKTEKKDEKKEEEVSYILQLSADRLLVTPDQPATLTVTVWKRTGERAPVPAPEASVTIGNPAGSGLSVSPSTGGSPLSARIAAAGEPAGSPVVLEVTATAGMTSKKAVVTVEVTGKADMEFF
jgi:hypothetical protein